MVTGTASRKAVVSVEIKDDSGERVVGRFPPSLLLSDRRRIHFGYVTRHRASRRRRRLRSSSSQWMHLKVMASILLLSFVLLRLLMLLRLSLAPSVT